MGMIALSIRGANLDVLEAVLGAVEIAAYCRKGRPTPATGSSQPVSVHLQADQPGRNDPCPCRSGRKYKFCCGRLH